MAKNSPNTAASQAQEKSDQERQLPSVIPAAWLRKEFEESMSLMRRMRDSVAKSLFNAGETKTSAKLRKQFEEGLAAFDQCIPGNINNKSGISWILHREGDIHTEEQKDELRKELEECITGAIRPLKDVKKYGGTVQGLRTTAAMELQRVCGLIRTQFRLPLNDEEMAQTNRTVISTTIPLTLEPAPMTGTATAIITETGTVVMPGEGNLPAAEPESASVAERTTETELPAESAPSVSFTVSAVTAETAPQIADAAASPAESGQKEVAANDLSLFMNSIHNYKEDGERAEAIGKLFQTLAVWIFEDDFLPKLREKFEGVYHFSEALSEKRAGKLEKLLHQHLLTPLRETIRLTAPTLIADYRATMRSPSVGVVVGETLDVRGPAERTLFKSVKEKVTERLTATSNDIMTHDEKGADHTDDPDSLSKVMYQCFREHCLQPFLLYIDLYDDPTQFNNVLRPALDARRTHRQKNGKGVDALSPTFALVLKKLMPGRCEGQQVPLSPMERAFVLQQMEKAGTSEMNRGRRSTIEQQLRLNFTGGLEVREGGFFKRQIADVAEEFNRRKRAALEQSRAAAPLPPPAYPPVPPPPELSKTPPPQAPPRTKEYHRQRELQELQDAIMRGALTDHEVRFVSEYIRSGVPGVGNKKKRVPFCEKLARRLNRECWEGSDQRDAAFVDKVLRAFDRGLIQQPTEAPAAAEEIDAIAAAPTEPTPAPETDEEAMDETTPASDEETVPPPPVVAPAVSVSAHAELPEASVWLQDLRKLLPAKLIGIHPDRLAIEDIQQKLIALEEEAPEVHEKLSDFQRLHANMLGGIEQCLALAKFEGVKSLRQQLPHAGGSDYSFDQFTGDLDLFLRGARELHAEIEHFRIRRNEVISAHDAIGKEYRASKKFLDTELNAILIIDRTRVRARLQGLFPNDQVVLELLKEDREGIELWRENEEHRSLLQERLLGKIEGLDTLAKNIEQAEKLMKLLGLGEAPSTESPPEQSDADEAAPADIVQEPAESDAPAPLSNGDHTLLSEHWAKHVTTLEFRTGRSKKEYPLNALQVRLLQLLSVVPTYKVDRDGKMQERTKKLSRDGRTPLAQNLWEGHGYEDLLKLWERVFGQPVPTRKEIDAAFEPISWGREPGKETPLESPTTQERQTAPIPVFIFMKVIHKKEGAEPIKYSLVLSSRTIDFIRNEMNGEYAMTPELQERILQEADGMMKQVSQRRQVAAEKRAQRYAQKLMHAQGSVQSEARGVAGIAQTLK